MKKLIITCFILTMTFSVNAQNWWGKRVKGNGNVTTETRKTSDYNSVSVAGSFNVALVKGKEGKITVKGEENLMKYIITEVSRKKLKIRFKKDINVRTTRKIVITVPYQDLEKVALSGSGDIYSKGVIKADDFAMSLAGSGNINLKVDANTVKSSIAGSGDINVSGKATDLNCSIAGSGNINAYKLKVVSTSARITGSGSIETTVSDSIDAKVVGSGNIYYKGKATRIKSKSIGSGDIIDRN